MTKQIDQALEVIPLGGLGEFGMHMMAFRCNGSIIVVDAGVAQTFAPDYKSALQEKLQALGHPLPEYRLSGSEGPDHRKTFNIEVVVNGEVFGAATGRAKKEAEQEAARLALARLDSQA